MARPGRHNFREVVPIPQAGLFVWVVAVPRGVVAGLLMFPIGALVLGHAPWRLPGLPLPLVVLILGAWV